EYLEITVGSCVARLLPSYFRLKIHAQTQAINLQEIANANGDFEVFLQFEAIVNEAKLDLDRRSRRLISRAGGQHWFAVNSGLEDLVVFGLAMDPDDPSILYA